MSQEAIYPPTGGGGSSSNASVGPTGSAAPSSATEIAGVTAGGILVPAKITAGGSLLVDASGTTQPVSGTVTVVQPTGTNLHTVVDAQVLPTGAATSALQSTTQGSATGGTAATASQLDGGIYNSSAPTLTTGQQAALQLDVNGQLRVTAAGVPTSLGQKTMANSQSIAIASDQSTVPTSSSDVVASGNITIQNSFPSSGAPTAGSTVSVTGLNGMCTATIQVTGTFTGNLSPQITLDGTNWIVAPALINYNTGLSALNMSSAVQTIWQVEITGASAFRVSANAAVTGTAVVTIRANAAQIISALLSPLPTGTNSVGTVILGAGSAAVGTVTQGTAGASPWLFAPNTSITSTITSVAGSATTVSLLASNVSRKGMTVQNESTAILYLKFGATASLTSYTVQIPAGAYYELPFIRVYTGAIDGIWSAANGNARITELT